MCWVLCLAEGRMMNNDDDNDEKHLLSSFKVSGTTLTALYALSHLILIPLNNIGTILSPIL